MPVNDKIRVPDYNDIRTKVVNVLGTGSGNRGYGQTVQSSAVSVSSRVTTNEWNLLRYDIINCYKHIFGSAPTIVEPSIGQTVRYSNTFVPDTGASDAPVTQYDTYATNIDNNRFTVAVGQSATKNKGSTSTTWPGIYGNWWNTQITCTVVVSFTSANQARYFFNSGGLIRFSSSRTGGVSTAQNNSWSSILSSAGTVSFGANSPAINWYNLTSSYQTYYTLSGSSPYGANSFSIQARTPSVNNSSGTALSAEFRLVYTDNYNDTAGPPPGDEVDGTFTVNASILYATGILEPTGTGNFAVEEPTITLGAIAP